MMALETATALGQTGPCSEQNNQLECSTMCALCGADRNVYQMDDDKWICVDHIGRVVSLAANGVFSHCVSYTREFEAVIL